MRAPSSSVRRPVAVTFMCDEPGQRYRLPGEMISPGEASLTFSAEMSASCCANCVVKLAGMCCTSKTAPGNSFGNEGISFINVAGPPVEAAITMMGNLPSPRRIAAESENMVGAGFGVDDGLSKALKLLLVAYPEGS